MDDTGNEIVQKNTIKIENPSCALRTFVVCNLVSELDSII